METGLKNLRVLVTGGASGIGRATALRFIEQGARVHVCDASTEMLQSLEASGHALTSSHCNVGDRADVERLFDDVGKSLGGLDCLVNNAGIAGPTGAVQDLNPSEWDQTLEVNITGQFNCTRLAIPLLKSSSNASIVNLASAAGRLGFGYRAPYAASKWAVVGFTKSLAIELGGDEIRVNAVAPGIIDGERQMRVLSEKAEKAGVSTDAMLEKALQNSSIKRLIPPEEIADTIVFLASRTARSISGQLISVCGDLQALT